MSRSRITNVLATVMVVVAGITSSSVFAGLTSDEATPYSITLTWTAPGDDAASGTAAVYDLRYSTSTITEANWDAAIQVTGEPTPSAAGSTETKEVTGLQPGTTYYFAIKAADEVPNWSAISNVISKATDPEDVAPALVADLATGNTAATALTLTWTAPGDDDNTGTAAEYDIRYSTSPITSINWSAATQISGEPAPQSAGSQESFVVNGLNSSTTYYFALATADEVPNWSGLSNVASGSTTSETQAPGAIANLGAGSPTEHSIEISWTAPGDDGTTGTASQYDIRYSTAYITEANFLAANQLSAPPAPLSAGSYQSAVVDGLNSETTYFFAIKTADEIPNWSPISNVATTSTQNDATSPLAVSTLNAVLPTGTSLTLVWLAPGDDGAVGTATTYDLRYSTTSINESNWSAATQLTSEPIPQSAGTPESTLVADLAEGVTYYFALKTADERNNWSALSNIASNSTAPDTEPPSSINDLAAIAGENNGEIILSWSAPGDDGPLGRVTAYEIRYSTSQINSENWGSALPWNTPPLPELSGTPQNVTLTSLVPGDNYFIGIKSHDDAANISPLSNVVSCEAKFVFILANGNLAQPSSPPSQAILSTARPVLVVENADASLLNVYRFELATDSNFFGLVAGGVVDQNESTTTSWKVDVPLQPKQEYYWRVATNDDGYSETFSFTVAPQTHAYPNPLLLSQYSQATFTDLPAGSDLLLTSMSGSIVREWSNLDGQDLNWNGTNANGNQVASGTYLWFIPSTGAKGKLVVIN